jgi:hypothetical protein
MERRSFISSEKFQPGKRSESFSSVTLIFKAEANKNFEHRPTMPIESCDRNYSGDIKWNCPKES